MASGHRLFVALLNATVVSLLLAGCPDATVVNRQHPRSSSLLQNQMERIGNVTITSSPSQLRHRSVTNDSLRSSFLSLFLSPPEVIQPETASAESGVSIARKGTVKVRDLFRSNDKDSTISAQKISLDIIDHHDTSAGIHPTSESAASETVLTAVTAPLASPRPALQQETFFNGDYDDVTADSRPLRHFRRSLPTAIIIGVKKCGTRALLEFLRAHPEVRATGPETHFFDRFYDLGFDWYRRQMPLSTPEQTTIEKTPSYFVTDKVPERIHRMSNATRLIVVVRDPVTRAISHYTQVLAKRRSNNIPPFEQLAFLPNASSSSSSSSSGLAGPPPPPPAINRGWGALQLGMYADHLEKWLRVFPLERLHFVSGERLIGDPGRELGRVQDFLGLRRILTERDFQFSSAKGFPCLLLRRRKSGSHAASSSGGRQGALHCLGKNKGRSHPQVKRDVIGRLREFFRPYNRKFYRMTGIDFGWP